MKKLLKVLSVAAMALSLVACKSSTTPESSEVAKLDPNKKYTVNFWHALGSSNGERIDALVERFNKSQDQITVIATFQGGYEDTSAKLQQSIAAGTAPEIAMIERAFIERYADAGVLADLNPFLKASGLSADMFVEGLMGYSYYNNDGKLVSVPFNRSTPILYYNKTLFEEKGIKVPETWAELEEAANALKGDGRYGITWPIETWYYKAMVAQLGGRTLNEDRTDLGFMDGTGEKVFEFWKRLQNSGALMVPPAKDGTTIACQAFIDQQSAMFMESTSLIGSLTKAIDGAFELGAAFLPMEKYRAMPTGGANIAMLNTVPAEQQAAAWVFMEWLMTDPQGAAIFIEQSGYLPFTKQMLESEAIKTLWEKNPNFRVAYDQLEYAVDTEQHLYWSEVKSEIKKMEQAIMHDNKDIKTTMEETSKQVRQILAQ